MPKTVVGLFANAVEAQNVKHELVKEGYSATDISVVANEASSSAAASSGAAGGVSSTDTGFAAKVSNFFHSLTGGSEDEQHYAAGVRNGGAMLSVLVPDGQEADVVELLESYGAENVDGQQERPTSAVAGAASQATTKRGASRSTVAPIVQEELAVGTRQVQRGGVRVYSHIVETPVDENVQLREEHIRVDRKPVNRPATEADFSAFKEGTIELTETAEEIVVSKNARVVEEVVVGKDASERTQTVRDTVRRTEVEVEQLGANQAASSASNFDTAFRDHFDSNYSGGGKAYESYAPAYQYGQTLANDPQYASSDWLSVQPDAERNWASQGSGKWDDLKSAMQQGWNKVRDSASSPKK